MTQRVSPNLFRLTFLGEARRMLFIAAGLIVALVAADLLDLASRKESARTRLG